MSKRITILTEKRDVAEKMAIAMGWSRGSRGYTGTFNGDQITVQWARGHLLTMQSPDDIDPTIGWKNPHRLTPIARGVQLKIVMETPNPERPNSELAQDRLKQVENALKDADEVYLATDADREGEFIGWSILEFLGYSGPVKRCWLAEGMDEISVKKAMNNLLPASAKKSLARAAEARARCDWGYMYLVRLLTYWASFSLLGSELGAGSGRQSVVSGGRVQSSALYMIYMREMQIRNFVPKAFFTVTADFNLTGALLNAEYDPKVTREIIDSEPPGIIWEPQGTENDPKLDRPLFTGVKEVGDFKARLLQHAGEAKVVKYEEGRRSEFPPITYDLVGAKSELAKRCKISGDVAQAVIEDLYDQGYISYPRTAHGELPNNLYEPAERDTRLRGVQGVPGLATAAQRALDIHGGTDKAYKPFRPKVFVAKKLEHHGLIPSNRPVTASVIAGITARKQINIKGKGVIAHTNAHMQEAYTFIAERYVQAMLPPVVYATQKIRFQVPTPDLLGSPETYFATKAERVIDGGWREIMGISVKADDASLAPIQNGTPAPLTEVKLKEGKTKCPSRYSEINFERALQKAAKEIDDPILRKYMADGSNKPEGIGTPATRKEIIPTLKARGYISADAKAMFQLELKGQQFIEFQIKHEQHWLYRIETTAEWEGRLAALAECEDDNEAIKMRDAFVEENTQTLEKYIHWMNDKFSSAPKVARAFVASVVTDNMKNAIKSISASKGIEIPKGALSDPVKASAFLNEHGAKREPGGSEGPFVMSEAQTNFLAKVEEAAGVKATDEEKADRQLIKQFIDKYKPKLEALMKEAAPSEKQVKFAKDLAAKLPADQQPKPEVFLRAMACKAFIDSQLKKKDSSGKGGKSGSSGSASTSRGAARPSSTKGRR